MKGTIYVIGGDLRQITVAGLLAKEGFTVRSAGLSDEVFTASVLKDADIIILPIPVSSDNVYVNAPLSKTRIPLTAVLDNVPPGCIVFGARITSEIERELKKRNLAFFDYYTREELIIKNAVPTAEGAIEIALSEMPVTLFGSNVLIIGYGRVGKALAERMSALGAYVSVSARKYSDFAWINERGLNAVHTNELANIADRYDLIVNTVPAMVLTHNVLEKVRPDALIIDLASKPGGVDFNSAKLLGRNVIWALSLPGKSAPVTSGKIIKETIMNILAETEV